MDIAGRNQAISHAPCCHRMALEANSSLIFLLLPGYASSLVFLPYSLL